jgi:Ca2+-binding EF-hand superfamily protein
MTKTRLLVGFAACNALLVAGAVLPTARAATADASVAKYDKDSDRTLDIAEVKAAAEAHFDQLDKASDNDSTLDSKEVKGVIGAKAFKAADPDHDGTIDKNEYLAYIAKVFDKVDTDHDGTIDAKELGTPSGQSLKRLID